MAISKYLKPWRYRGNIWKTLYINLKYFGLKDALRLPVFIAKNVILRDLSGQIKFEGVVKMGKVQIGFRDMGIQNERDRKTILDLKKGSTLTFKGNASLGGGARIYTKGNLEIGDNFYLSLNSTLIAHDSVKIGRDVTLGWDSLIMDTDFHEIYNSESGEQYPMTKPIIIGNHCWICNNCQILKGSEIPDETIIASMSLINRKLNTPPNSILAGIPVALKKTCVTHKR